MSPVSRDSISCWWLPSSCMVMSMLSKFCALSCRCVSISHMKLNSEFSPMYLLLIIFVTATPTYYRGVNIPSLKAPTDVAWCVWLKAWSSLQKNQVHRDTEASIHDLGQKNMYTLIEALKHIYMHKYTYKFIPSWPRVLHKDVSTLSDHIHSWFQVTRHQARSMSMAKNILKNLTLCHQKHRVLYAQTPIPEILKYEFPRNFPTTIPNSSEKCPPKHWFLGENHHVFLLKVQLYAFGRNLELAFFAKSGRFAAFFWNPHFLISAWWAQWVCHMFITFLIWADVFCVAGRVFGARLVSQVETMAHRWLVSYCVFVVIQGWRALQPRFAFMFVCSSSIVYFAFHGSFVFCDSRRRSNTFGPLPVFGFESKIVFCSGVTGAQFNSPPFNASILSCWWRL